MAYSQEENTGTGRAQAAHLTAMVGPLIPWLIYRRARAHGGLVATESAKATNFGALALAAFLAATAVASLVPLVGFVGTLAQLGVSVATVVLCTQASLTVRRGLPAAYPFDLKLVREDND
jgi:uncharacterized Tic20 family protein